MAVLAGKVVPRIGLGRILRAAADIAGRLGDEGVAVADEIILRTRTERRNVDLVIVGLSVPKDVPHAKHEERRKRDAGIDGKRPQ